MINNKILKNKSGFLLLNKPKGPTSFDMVYKLRKITGIKKIGHAGTLDPFASGLLIMAIGREATKQISKYVKLDKEYIATLKLGATSTTHDPEGKIKENKNYEYPSRKKIENVLKNFLGKQEQIPPMFSAKKIKGKRLYDLARKGIEIKREAVNIDIKNIELLEYEWPNLRIKVSVSSGTYIRVLAFDIGEVLKTGAYLSKLKRTKIGKFKLDEAVLIESLREDDWDKFLI